MLQCWSTPDEGSIRFDNLNRLRSLQHHFRYQYSVRVRRPAPGEGASVLAEPFQEPTREPRLDASRAPTGSTQQRLHGDEPSIGFVDSGDTMLLSLVVLSRAALRPTEPAPQVLPLSPMLRALRGLVNGNRQRHRSARGPTSPYGTRQRPTPAHASRGGRRHISSSRRPMLSSILAALSKSGAYSTE